MDEAALRVVALTGGHDVPSARFRIRQLIPSLLQESIVLRELCPTVSSYPPQGTIARILWAPAALLTRLPGILFSRRADVVVFQRELVSTLVTLEPLAGKPRILDVDDAIHLRGRGGFTQRLCSYVDHVVCGNAYLANHYSRLVKNVSIVPTAVNAVRYCPAVGASTRPIIGWIGTSANYQNLAVAGKGIARALAEIADARLRIVADRPPELPDVPADRVEFIPWSRENEVRLIQEMTVGIMPLLDNEWNRGKCSYKMLQYMACGVPVVVSPVGMNVEVLSLGDIGVGVSNADQWTEALLMYLRDQDLAKVTGERGREIILKHFSIDVIVPRLAAIWREVAG